MARVRSLPVWECGLKSQPEIVTPEIFAVSLPVWECGLKSLTLSNASFNLLVTPCVGVWIEIRTYQKNCWSKAVTPCVGVWIEILHLPCSAQIQTVTPCVGVWIEIPILYLQATAIAGHSLCGSVD